MFCFYVDVSVQMFMHVNVRLSPSMVVDIRTTNPLFWTRNYKVARIKE